MASIVTADGPLSTSNSVAAEITAARLRATRGSRSSTTGRPPASPCDDCRTQVSVNPWLKFVIKQYDTVSYHKPGRRVPTMTTTSPHIDQTNSRHTNPQDTNHPDHIPAEDLVTDAKRQRRILIA